MSLLRVGIAGPVGCGKTALVEALCGKLIGTMQCKKVAWWQVVQQLI